MEFMTTEMRDLKVPPVNIRKFKYQKICGCSNLVVLKMSVNKGLKDFPKGNMKKTRFYGYVCDFSVDYDAIAVNDVLDIHKYFMKKHNTKLCCDIWS